MHNIIIKKQSVAVAKSTAYSTENPTKTDLHKKLYFPLQQSSIELC